MEVRVGGRYCSLPFGVCVKSLSFHQGTLPILNSVFYDVAREAVAVMVLIML
jgi:hypothetical protein